MKINELSQSKQIDEGIGSALIGDRAASAIRGFFSGQGTKQTMFQKAFLKDFYQDAITSLDNGISGGFINTNLSSNLGQQTQQPEPENQPDSKKSTPPTEIPTAPKKTGPSSAEQTVAAAQQHRQDVASASNRMAAGRAAQAKPAFQRTADDKLAMKAAGLSESHYQTLNNLFESIISEMDGAGGVSIGQYMLDWFNAYMQNTKWESYKAQVLPMIQRIEDTFSRDKGKRAIQQLAQTALSISKLSPMPPKGAENIIPNQGGSQGENPVSSALKKIGGGPDQEKVEHLAAMEKNDPEGFAKAMQARGYNKG